MLLSLLLYQIITAQNLSVHDTICWYLAELKGYFPVYQCHRRSRLCFHHHQRYLQSLRPTKWKLSSLLMQLLLWHVVAAVSSVEHAGLTGAGLELLALSSSQLSSSSSSTSSSSESESEAHSLKVVEPSGYMMTLPVLGCRLARL